MKTFIQLAFMLAFLVGTMVSAQNPLEALEKLNQQLTHFRQNNADEKTLVITDKDTYCPGEVLWFKTFIFQPGDSLKSHTLYIDLIDLQGNKINTKLFEIFGNTVSGNLQLPKGKAEGLYTLAVYTSVQKQRLNPSVFYKKILISQPNPSQLWVETNKQSYKSGEQVVVTYKLNDENRKSEQIDYQLLKNESTILRGKTKGQLVFTLPNNIVEGDYILDVTSKNGAIFSKSLSTIRVLDSTITVDIHTQADKLVAGIANTVTFRIKDSNNNLLNAKGVLVDNNNQTIAEVATLYPGLAKLSFIPQKGSTYQLIVSDPVKSTKKITLPEVTDAGFQINDWSMDSDTLTIRILSNYGSGIKQICWTVEKNDQLYWAASGRIRNEHTVRIPRKGLPPSPFRFTVFDPSMEVLCETHMAIPDLPDINLSVSDLKIEDNNLNSWQVNTQFSDSAIVPIALTARIVPANSSQPIQQYAFYNDEALTNISIESPEMAEMLATTNPALNRDWKMIQTQNQNGPKTKQNGVIKGWVTDSKGNRSANATVYFVHTGNWGNMQVKTDEQGEFYIDDLRYNYESGAVNYSALLTNGQKGIVHFDESFDKWLTNSCYGIGNMQSLTFTSNTHSSHVKSNKKNNKPLANNNLTQYQQFYAPNKKLADIIFQMKPYKLVNNKIVFSYQYSSLSVQQGALIVVDGAKIGENASVLDAIAPEDVYDVRIHTSSSDIQQFTGLNTVGVIEILTKRGPQHAPVINTHSWTVSQLGTYQQPETFITSSDLCNKPSITQYWNPELWSDDNGNALLLAPKCDSNQNYTLIIETLTPKNKLVRISIPTNKSK